MFSMSPSAASSPVAKAEANAITASASVAS
jgi:hypothetical protein